MNWTLNLRSQFIETIFKLETGKGGSLGSSKTRRGFIHKLQQTAGVRGFGKKPTYAGHKSAYSRQTGFGMSQSMNETEWGGPDHHYSNEIRRGVNFRQKGGGQMGKTNRTITNLVELNHAFNNYDSKHYSGASEMKGLWHLWTDRIKGDDYLKPWIQEAIDNEGGIGWKHGRPQLLSEGGGAFSMNGATNSGMEWALTELQYTGHAAQGHWRLGFENKMSKHDGNLAKYTGSWQYMVQVYEDDNNPSGFGLCVLESRLFAEHIYRFKNTFEVMTEGAKPRGFLTGNNRTDTRVQPIVNQFSSMKSKGSIKPAKRSKKRTPTAAQNKVLLSQSNTTNSAQQRIGGRQSGVNNKVSDDLSPNGQASQPSMTRTKDL